MRVHGKVAGGNRLFPTTLNIKSRKVKGMEGIGRMGRLTPRPSARLKRRSPAAQRPLARVTRPAV
jgi:hypothetical protein